MASFVSRQLRSKTKFIEGHILHYVSRKLDWETSADLLVPDEVSTDNDTVFIMGSGSSLNDMDQKEWGHINSVGDVMGFNYFHKGEFVPVDYHVMREVSGSPWTHFGKRQHIKEYVESINSNPCYKNTTFFIFDDGFARDSLSALYRFDLFDDKEVCRCANDRSFFDEAIRSLSQGKLFKDREFKPPSEDIMQLPYGGGTLFEAVNIAYILGYDTIVLVGVDLYDRRYFWLGDDEARSGDKRRKADQDDSHNTAKPVLRGMEQWNEFLKINGVQLQVYNPYSLLHTKDVLEKYDCIQTSISIN